MGVGGGAAAEAAAVAGALPLTPGKAPAAAGAGAGSAPALDDTAVREPLAAPGAGDAPGEATIDSVFNVPGVGVVVAGTVLRGAIRTGATMLLGPDRVGEFQPVFVRSIHVHYTPVDVALPGGSAAFAIRAKAHKGGKGTAFAAGHGGGKGKW